ncbi:hypothetical protein PGT21_028947 [Puccinia graminis f. sp. tritici]|uniref:Uncharacterized protein n=1 Tax=Puccinia graminis f. sp. tritici TaxID=56615 RepID=A0A5B0RRK1_PUCGR|nr:hypothetical protein PGT21_028947 [Puccinia graminis f. sp. tritici]KAA1127979.1 hypothetical protein PGTUg99_012389 [Puccinia graminis f. sp. tritici]
MSATLWNLLPNLKGICLPSTIINHLTHLPSQSYLKAISRLLINRFKPATILIPIQGSSSICSTCLNQQQYHQHNNNNNNNSSNNSNNPHLKLKLIHPSSKTSSLITRPINCNLP